MEHTSAARGSIGRDDAILATWTGRCPDCREPIRRGDLVVKIDGRWLHDDCDQAAADRDAEGDS